MEAERAELRGIAEGSAFTRGANPLPRWEHPPMLQIRELETEDVIAIPAVDGGSAWHGGIAKWAGYRDQHARGDRLCLVALKNGEIVGYGSLVWHSQHLEFAAADIPEIQDMVVSQFSRGEGVATALIAAFEERALAHGHSEIGIGFGLYSDYGAAQRLYVSLGYGPDGCGVTWKNETVAPGAIVHVDDDLVLWLSKSLR